MADFYLGAIAAASQTKTQELKMTDESPDQQTPPEIPPEQRAEPRPEPTDMPRIVELQISDEIYQELQDAREGNIPLALELGSTRRHSGLVLVFPKERDSPAQMYANRKLSLWNKALGRTCQRGYKPRQTGVEMAYSCRGGWWDDGVVNRVRRMLNRG